MKIKSEQLISYLTPNLAPIYLVSGDEYLLVEEACNTVRQYAAKAGHSDREIFYIESGFNWEHFLASVNNTSLFSDRALIELHLKSKLTESGSNILQTYLKNPSPDKIILIISNKLDAAQQKSAWFKAIDAQGITLQIWPIELNQLPFWLNKRLKAAGLNVDPPGLQLLVDQVAGNLLAAVQEIEKLSLLYGQGNLTTEQISDASTDHAHFNIFQLLDAAINNQIAAVNRILDQLKSENAEPTLLLWTITNELRTLVKISYDIKHGVSTDQAITQHRVWSNRKLLVKKVLGRYDLGQLQNFLKSALRIDLIIKGADKQHLLWHELSKFYLSFAGAQCYLVK